MIERVTLQALYLNKNISLNHGFPIVNFEKKIPAYTLIDANTNNFNIIDDSAIVGPGEITAGASMTTVGGHTLSNLIGFIPYDSRITSSTALNIKVLGKYMGPIPSPGSIVLNFTYEEINSPNNISAAIAGVVLSDTVVVAGTAVNTYELLEFDFGTFAPNAALDGIRFEIERVGASFGTELSFQVTNVYVQALPVDSFGDIEDVYEDSTTLVDIIDANDDALNIQVDGDLSGFLFAAGPGAESLFVPFKFDKRYNFRENINIDVFGYVTAASATDVGLDLAISNFYDFDDLAPNLGSLYTTIQSAQVSITAATGAPNAYFIKHSFTLSAKDLWQLTGPAPYRPYPRYSQFRDSGYAALLLRLKRNDAGAGSYTAMNVHTYTDKGKKSSVEGLYVNVSESVDDPENSYLEIKSAYRADKAYNGSSMVTRNLLASAHRYYFNYAIDGEVIADTADEIMPPVGVSATGRTYGLIVPFNMAIIGVYGFGDASAGPIPGGVALEINLVDSGGAPLNTNDGVVHLPMETLSITPVGPAVGGGWRWTGNPLNFNAPVTTHDSHNIPLIYLPQNYSSTGWDSDPPLPASYVGNVWLLTCTAINDSGGSITLTANVTVEAVILPNFSVTD